MYEYLDREPQVGDVVERNYVSGVGTSKGIKDGDIGIVSSKQDDIITVEGYGEYVSIYFKVIKTKPASEAKIGDSVICIKHSGKRQIGDVYHNIPLSKYLYYTEGMSNTHNQFLVLCKDNKLDIDYWQKKFESGEDVWVKHDDIYTTKCKDTPPNKWKNVETFYDHDPRVKDIKCEFNVGDIVLDAHGIECNVLNIKNNKIYFINSKGINGTMDFWFIKQEGIKPIKQAEEQTMKVEIEITDEMIKQEVVEVPKTDLELAKKSFCRWFNEVGAEVDSTTSSKKQAIKLLKTEPWRLGWTFVVYRKTSSMTTDIPVVEVK